MMKEIWIESGVECIMGVEVTIQLLLLEMALVEAEVAAATIQSQIQ
jgi:hypothetical protein